MSFDHVMAIACAWTITLLYIYLYVWGLNLRLNNINYSCWYFSSSVNHHILILNLWNTIQLKYHNQWVSYLWYKLYLIDTLVAECILLFTTNLAIVSYSSQSFCLWFTENWRYCFNSWFIYLICPSICGWKDIDNLVLISNILFNSLINSTINCSTLFNIVLSSNPYNFYILSLNNCTNPPTIVSSVVIIKYAILDNLLQTTRIISFPATNGNLVMKSTNC